ncbi:serine/threonine protein kinase [Trichophyton rubrum D6]|uniref:Serine/threonine protein kinase n=2 Tax=Trichophyton TaxID=5550 RepID=A0A022VVB2_TRIRU|nr:serine/threonine protein kinase [Trichophyton rubrum MR850]EZF39429.1 serine/threonine protein kinase [Trichophyton rubrum CBS 100081]EZF50025.1 serine/threonine protein kinase [Trichophyton rubrum CBS 288.86]EZF60659.1 serine/threonine protein kinase [Trichophyton rubrum CBS 289.86]EZF71269.1 serine/threonine protein kinase [Trichophyton soudanense CBS 452.61]EZF82007.1 serine/threonine protein kinase [Trichophyton rubrum MR1448]EZF92674.1 serine/threonine protein kinase [Trichophyton rub
MDPTKDTSPEFRRKFKWIKKLGNGSFGAVYLFESRLTREKFACKVAVDPGAQEALLREVAILKRLHHPNIIEYVTSHFYLNQRPNCLIMAYHPLGSLENYNFSTQEALKVVHQCLRALKYLEEMALFHRDIKEDNILLKSISPLHVCLADFGLAVTSREGATNGGQLTHVAVEVYLGRGYSYIADIWSLGVTALSLLRRFPKREAQCFFRARDRAQEAKYYERLLSEASSLHGYFGELVKHMLCTPDVRWTAVECLRYLGEGHDAGPSRPVHGRS